MSKCRFILMHFCAGAEFRHGIVEQMEGLNFMDKLRRLKAVAVEFVGERM